MTDINTIPKVVNIVHYGGDTLTIKVTAPGQLVAGLDWDAQVRSVRESETVAATFDVTPPAIADGPAYLVLQSEASAALIGGAPVIRRRTGPPGSPTVQLIQQFRGVWDCQVSAGGDDPVTTLVQGSIILEMDVTRVP